MGGNSSEWQDWALAAATANSAVEGFTPTTASIARNRRSNNVQIFSKAFQVADSILEGIDIAGIKSEYQFQADAAFTNMRRDIEWAFMNNSAAVTGTTAVAAVMCGVIGAITTNIISASTTATSVFSESDFISGLSKIFAQRGVYADLDIHACPVDVARIMGFTGPGTATKFLNVMPDTTVHQRTVSIIATNFGKCSIIPNNLLAGLGKMVYADMKTWALAVKVPPVLKALAKTTDSTSAYWKTEITLEWLNQSANALMSAIATA